MTTQKIKRPLAQVSAIAQALVASFRPYCERIEIAGSLRRGKPTVGDIELVAVPAGVPTDLFGNRQVDKPTAMDAYLSELPITLLKNGAKYKQFSFKSRMGELYTVDLFLQPDPETWGVNFMIRTGSADFSRMMVTKKNKGGWCPDNYHFREGRIWHKGEVLSTPEERDVFDVLDVPWVEPRDREVPHA